MRFGRIKSPSRAWTAGACVALLLTGMLRLGASAFADGAVADSIPPPDDLAMPFGYVPAGTSHVEHVTVTNTHAEEDLVIEDVYVAGCGSFRLAGLPARPYVLAPGAACSFEVIYEPLSGASDDGIGYTNEFGAVRVSLSGLYSIEVRVIPEAPYAAAGWRGGPFSPPSVVYVLSNQYDRTFSWQVLHSESWLDVAPSEGILSARSATNVTVSVNAGATGLAPGTYADEVTFTNVTDRAGARRPVELTVRPVRFWLEISRR